MKSIRQRHPIQSVYLLAVLVGLIGLAEVVLAHEPPGASEIPKGLYIATISDEGDIAGMSVVILDAPQPAVMIRYEATDMLTVYDSDQRPFLRFTQNSVEANVQSSYWKSLPQSQSYEVTGGNRWLQVSGSGSFGWVDPRLSRTSQSQQDSQTQWIIPVRKGEHTASSIRGRLEWRPLITDSAKSGH